jgi:muramoyltetrapeptide carboxypeptidase
MIIPPKLKARDLVRIIAPAGSMSCECKELLPLASKRLEQLDLELSFAKNLEESDIFGSSSIESRVNDLHQAFSDKQVKLVLALVGGFNSNQLLRHLDYDLIKANPKIFCGYSDITALANAIYAKTTLITYSGPNFINFADNKCINYILEYFKKCFFSEEHFSVVPSEEWFFDPWCDCPKNSKVIKNKGYALINEGESSGAIIGGNLCTLNLLQGTEYFPSLNNAILFIEDDYEVKGSHFDRDLQSLIHQADFPKVKGILIGRFQETSNMDIEKITQIIKTKRELKNIPVIANVDFGHTTPLFSFPIGGLARIKATSHQISIEILQH